MGLPAVPESSVFPRDDFRRPPLTNSTPSIVNAYHVLGGDPPTGDADAANGCKSLRRRLSAGDAILNSPLADAEAVTTKRDQTSAQQKGTRCTYRVNPLGAKRKLGQSILLYSDLLPTVTQGRTGVRADIQENERDVVGTAWVIPGSVRSIVWRVFVRHRESRTYKQQPPAISTAGPRPTFGTTATYVYNSILRLGLARGHPPRAHESPVPHIHTSVGQRS